MDTDPAEPTIVVRSPAFGANGAIPMEFSVEGDNVPPPLAWEQLPEATQSIAIVCEDPDAPARTFTHWIVVGIPPSATHLDPSAPPRGAAFGKNDHGSLGWYGPNPPSGRHRYVFKVFALDIHLDKPGLSNAELYKTMKHHVLAHGELVGTYEKKRTKGPSATGSHH